VLDLNFILSQKLAKDILNFPPESGIEDIENYDSRKGAKHVLSVVEGVAKVTGRNP